MNALYVLYSSYSYSYQTSIHSCLFRLETPNLYTYIYTHEYNIPIRGKRPRSTVFGDRVRWIPRPERRNEISIAYGDTTERK